MWRVVFLSLVFILVIQQVFAGKRDVQRGVCCAASVLLFYVEKDVCFGVDHIVCSFFPSRRVWVCACGSLYCANKHIMQNVGKRKLSNEIFVA